MKLHLGCGNNYMDGWVNIDGPKEELCYDTIKADIYVRIEDLEYPDNSIDEILLNAVFEHFPRHIAILQLRKFYKWLKPNGMLTILVPDFWGTVKLLKKSKSPNEQQFWFRHLYGPQDTLQLGTHYDAFDVKKLKYMFSVVGFNSYQYEIKKRWPGIKFTGIKDTTYKPDDEAIQDIITYMAFFETKDENGVAFKEWMRLMGIKAEKPVTPVFKTHEMYKNRSLIGKMKAIPGWIFDNCRHK